MSHVGHGTSPKIVPAAEYHMGIAWMISTLRFRTKPQVPVQSVGNRWLVGRQLGILRPNGTVGPVMYFFQGSDGARMDPGHHCFHRSVGIPGNKMRDHLRMALGHSDHMLSLDQPVGYG